ncbi:MAG: hypothetical protein ACFFG0_08315 [Candidatus Thorarchaeota archaeon]
MKTEKEIIDKISELLKDLKDSDDLTEELYLSMVIKALSWVLEKGVII